MAPAPKPFKFLCPLRRHKFAEVSYLRCAKRGAAAEHWEHTVVFLVDAWALAKHVRVDH